MKKINFRYQPTHTGLTQVFGSLEKDIMEILWKKGELTGRALSDDVQQVHAAAHTTVLTVVGRLIKKGYIKKEKKESVFVFSPAFTKKEFNNHVTREVIQGLKKLSNDSPIKY